MWKKRFVTRLTRMGLSTYLLMFCLSFTVCAEEYPLNDLIVPEFSEISSGIEEEEIFEDGEEASFFEEINNTKETEPGIGEDIGTNQTDIGFNRTNNTIEEEIEDGELRVTFEDAMVDFFFEGDKITAVSWGVLVDEQGDII